MKKGNEPCQLIYDYNGNIWVVNDTQRTHNMKASMTIYGLDGKILAKDSKMVESQPRVPQKVFKVSEIKGNGPRLCAFRRQGQKDSLPPR